MSQQLSLIVLDDKAYEAAQALIRTYVKRGDPMSFLHDMGASSPNSYSVSIGGYLDGKKYSNEKILVSRDMEGKVVNRVYSLKAVYEDIKAEG